MNLTDEQIATLKRKITFSVCLEIEEGYKIFENVENFTEAFLNDVNGIDIEGLKRNG